MNHIKQFTFAMLVALASSPEANAYDFSAVNSDGVTIYYDIIEGEASVTYKTTSYNSYSGDVVVPSSVVNEGTKYVVTQIGNYAFRSCSDLNRVLLPNTINKIGSSAFSGCSKLNQIILPPYLNKINSGTFWNCDNLESITIPAAVESIDNQAFGNCKNLSELIFEDSTTPIKLGNNKYSDGVGGGLFEDCPISKFYIGRNIEYSYLGNSRPYENAPFRYYYGNSQNQTLKYVTIGESVTKLPDYLFYSCVNLKYITIPSSVQNIGSIFGNGYGKESKSLICDIYMYGTNPPVIGKQYFNNNSCNLFVPKGSKTLYLNEETWKEFNNIIEMEDLEFPKSIDGFTYGYNCGNTTELAVIEKHSSCSNVEIASNVNNIPVTRIDNCLFMNDTEVESVILPNSITNLGDSTFYNCI